MAILSVERLKKIQRTMFRALVFRHTSSSLESSPNTASFLTGLLVDFLVGIMSPYLPNKVIRDEVTKVVSFDYLISSIGHYFFGSPIMSHYVLSMNLTQKKNRKTSSSDAVSPMFCTQTSALKEKWVSSFAHERCRVVYATIIVIFIFSCPLRCQKDGYCWTLGSNKPI